MIKEINGKIYKRFIKKFDDLTEANDFANVTPDSEILANLGPIVVVSYYKEAILGVDYIRGKKSELPKILDHIYEIGKSTNHYLNDLTFESQMPTDPKKIGPYVVFHLTKNPLSIKATDIFIE